jgi:hypothetical protein
LEAATTTTNNSGFIAAMALDFDLFQSKARFVSQAMI